jgi:hypothetical protein
MAREKYAAAPKIAEDQNEPQAATTYDELRLRAIAAQRAALHRLRARGEIGEEAFHRIQEELDWVRTRCRASRKLSIAGEVRQIAGAAPVTGVRERKAPALRLGLGCASRLRLRSVRKEVLEPDRRQLDVADRTPDVFGAEISLD